MTTSFEDKCSILSELWSEFKEEEDWVDFCDSNYIGLSLAFVLDMNLVENPSQLAKSFIEQAFTLFLTQLKLEDTGWNELEQIFDTVEEKTS